MKDEFNLSTYHLQKSDPERERQLIADASDYLLKVFNGKHITFKEKLIFCLAVVAGWLCCWMKITTLLDKVIPYPSYMNSGYSWTWRHSLQLSKVKTARSYAILWIAILEKWKSGVYQLNNRMAEKRIDNRMKHLRKAVMFFAIETWPNLGSYLKKTAPPTIGGSK